MPNWVFNSVTPDDYVARDIIKEHCLVQGKTFTFNKLVPCPPVLNSVRSPVDVIGPNEDIGKLKSKVHEKFKHLVEEGVFVFDEFTGGRITKEAQDKFIKEYGFDNWYDWRLHNWGTKWDAGYHDQEDNTYYFETPWSEPMGFMEKLADILPEGSSIGWCAESEEGEVCEYTLTKGKVTLDNQYYHNEGEDDDI